VMWAHDVDTPEYSELLDSIERQLPPQAAGGQEAQNNS